MADLDEKALEAAVAAFLDADGWTFGPEDCRAGPHSRLIAKVIRAYLDATPPVAVTGEVAGQREPRVRALEWPEECPRGRRVRGLGIFDVEYAIVCVGEERIYRWAPPKSAWSEPYATYFAAKVAAQADYERRILSALDLPAPTEGEGA